MNKKGEATNLTIGIILVVFITVLVGVILFQAIAQQAGSGTSTVDLADFQATLAANGNSIYLDYRSLGGTVLIENATGGVIAAGNYTVTNNAIDPSDGTLSVQLQTDTTEFQNELVNITSAGTQPQTYIADNAGRAVVGLIAIFFALAIAIVALEPTLRSGVLNMLGK